MQLTRDHPELVRRLVLVSAGGLGRKIHPVFRAATLPVATPLFRLALNERTAPILRRRPAAPFAAVVRRWWPTSVEPAVA